jgi:hypothetical protein
MNDEQDGRQAMDRISKSRESCHPVKNPNRDLPDTSSNKTIKGYWIANLSHIFSGQHTVSEGIAEWKTRPILR